MQLTPMFEQYQQIKNKYKDNLLLFRVGDFYEFYYDDAKLASSCLGITLTAKTIQKGSKVPLAGVPIKASENYISRLVELGFKIAICEQLEPATKGKKLVARDVVEVITPGTILRPSLLDEKKPLFIAGCLPDEKKVGVAFCDITSGEFSCCEVEPEQLNELLLRKEVREIVLPEGINIDCRITITHLDGYHYVSEIAHKKICEHFKVLKLDGFGIEGLNLAIGASGALLYYLSESQKTTLGHIDRLQLFQAHDTMYLDATTDRKSAV